ncbi:MAG TPA: hypothetical protein VG273_26390 [Bryobacteraceae bacterium]|jgi:hypothetical protein|nr:hypothetical protein [Bryobacteraceae bacterium]
MPDFTISDSLGNPVDISQVKWTSASSLYNYAKSESLHLIVAPDYIKVKDQLLTAAAPTPLKFSLTSGRDFTIGTAAPEVDITPAAKIELKINATAGADLFGDDDFHVAAEVPAQTGYLGLSFTGSVDAGVSATSGDVTFGIDASGSITYEYFKAFPTGANQPTVTSAMKTMMACFTIPAAVEDLANLDVNDVCCVSGTGSLKVSGCVDFSLLVNPLASVNLPLPVGTLTVQDGLAAGISADVTLTGSYQIRVEKQPGGIIRLSCLQSADKAFEVDASASAGVSVNHGDTDLLAKMLGSIEKGGVDSKVLSSLTADEIGDFNGAIKQGLDHSLQASLTLALSAERDKCVAFQYELAPGSFDARAKDAVGRALKGDLRMLTALEANARPDGTMGPGIKLLNSVLSTARSKGASLRVNLLGIVNLITMSQLVNNCEFLFEPSSGDLTIKETAQSEKISAITDPVKRQNALRKALFDSVLTTTTYLVGKTVAMPSLSCAAVYFAANRNTGKQALADYTNWFTILNLMTADERHGILAGFGGGGNSACTVRVPLDDRLCESLFFDRAGALRARAEYLEIGRQALKSLLDPAAGTIDQVRYQVLNDATSWASAVKSGPSPELRSLIPLNPTDPSFELALQVVTGDVYDIAWWASGMANAGLALQHVRDFLAGRDPASLQGDPAFASQRNELQKSMLTMAATSKARFDQPWGLMCLFQAAGAPPASGTLKTQVLSIERTGAAVLSATPGRG